jgi:L-threonylcarbamoyladenylate synthase
MQTVIGSDILRAAELLTAGKVVAIPTETVYGLAANALHAEAVTEIFKVKGRPFFDPLIVHIASTDSLNDLVEMMPAAAWKLAEAFWPGPLTLVLPRRSVVPDITTSGLETVGIRMPAHPMCLELLRALPFPLAAPSANPFGYISPTTAMHVYHQMGGKIPYILDGGSCTVGVESTIVRFDKNGELPQVLRMGGTSVEAIRSVIGEVEVFQQSSSKPNAPGMLLSHYAPQKPFFLGSIDLFLKEHPHMTIGVLSFCSSYDVLHNEVLSPRADLSEAARNLFGAMRRLDAFDCDAIIAELVPDEALGRAINDRLRRAAGAILPA